MNEAKAEGFRRHLMERIDACEDNLEEHVSAWLELIRLARDLQAIVEQPAKLGMQLFAQLIEIEIETHGDRILRDIPPDGVDAQEWAVMRQRFALLDRIRVDWQKTSLEGDSDAQLLQQALGADVSSHEGQTANG